MRYKRQLEVRHYNIKQEIDSFILPPNTWYRDIGGKYSHVEIIVGLQSQYHLEKNETIEVAISCHYGSGYHEEITSDKPLYTILENLSRLKIDDSGSAIICLRFEQLSTRHSNEVILYFIITLHYIALLFSFLFFYIIEICYSYFC